MRRYFTSRMVSVCDIIWMLIWDWLVGRTSLERERGTMVFLLFGMDAEAAALDLRYISVLMNNRSISDELKLRTPYAVLSNLSGLQGILRQKPNNADSIIESLFNEGPKKIPFHFILTLLTWFNQNCAIILRLLGEREVKCLWKRMRIAIHTRYMTFRPSNRKQSITRTFLNELISKKVLRDRFETILPDVGMVAL